MVGFPIHFIVSRFCMGTLLVCAAGFLDAFAFRAPHMPPAICYHAGLMTLISIFLGKGGIPILFVGSVLGAGLVGHVDPELAFTPLLLFGRAALTAGCAGFAAFLLPKLNRLRVQQTEPVTRFLFQSLLGGLVVTLVFGPAHVFLRSMTDASQLFLFEGPLWWEGTIVFIGTSVLFGCVVLIRQALRAGQRSDLFLSLLAAGLLPVAYLTHRAQANTEYSKIQNMLVTHTNLFQNAIEDRFAKLELLLRVLSRSLSEHPVVSSDLFKRHVNPVLREAKWIAAIEWIDVSNEEGRTSYPVRLLETSLDLDVTPFIGLDLALLPKRALPIARAVESGHITYSEHVQLFTNMQDNSGFLVFTPDSFPDPAGSARGPARGIIGAIIHSPGFFIGLGESTHDQIELKLLGPGDAVFVHTKAAEVTSASSRSSISYSEPLNIGPQDMKIVVSFQTPNSVPALVSRESLNHLALVGLSFIASLLLFQKGERNQRMRSLIDRLEARTKELEVVQQERSRFLASVSHEVRTPLTAILGYTNLLMEKSRDPSDLHNLKTVQSNGEHLLALINDILDLSKIQAGELKLEFECVDATQLADEILYSVQPLAQRHQIVLAAELPGQSVVLNADPTRLKQILLNILGNAIKFSARGQTVKFQLQTSSESQTVSLVVTDNGPGIDPKDHERIFLPFTQVGARQHRTGGTGLGLAISQQLCAKMGGAISLQSALGQGSCFTVTFPLQTLPSTGAQHERRTEREAPRACDATPDAIEGANILIVEDAPDIRRLLSEVLRASGARIQTAEHGQQAVEYVQQLEPGSLQLVLMDIEMPLMDGIQAAKELRKLGYHGPLVALTAHAMQGDFQKCMEAGFDHYISKPIMPKKLREKVKAFLRAP